MAELGKSYNPKEAEEKWYPFWENNGFFHATVNPNKKPYTIVIPPPNITGILTMGHVLNNTIQDVLIRWKRMQGYETLWLPGTDHAGIATQNVVEKSLAKEKISKQDLGREEFLKRVWKWKEQYGSTIIKQLKKLGASCDWSRERFTMDEGLSNAVKEVFVYLYNKGLIYRGKYIVNWCPKDHTAISDDEVNYTEESSYLWYIKYPLVNSNDYIIVATTRPETMLGDTAVAVNPKDDRFKHFVGKKAILPLTQREIPIIADEAVEIEFGTGAVKVTPAHDPNDYWIGKRHLMTPINILDTSARLNENVPLKYQGLDRYTARENIISDLEKLGLLVKTEPYKHNVGRCYRCNTIIEPYLSDQWFVKMKPLAEPALKVVLEGKIRFHPERWVKVYEHWMTNIRDWCISRQLWWGHRIPVWYCEEKKTDECNQPLVSRSKPDRCPHCQSKQIHQDEDVLDTWFSSWLWPFSTLGWPQENKDLEYFYPTNTLVTGPDIIFFWVARMIIAGLEIMHDVPFKDVYFTSIIRDIKGRKMSKSLGNSPDPLDVINEYGADALRFTVLYLAPLGQDVLYSNEKCEIGRNFANKIWNAGRFLLLNKEQISINYCEDNISDNHLDLADRWILSRLNTTIYELNRALEQFEINLATKILYDFVWHDFCDWYIEIIKGRLYSNEPLEIKKIILNRALYIFDQTLRLLHPFMPFVTEELWQCIEKRDAKDSIMVSSFPNCEAKWIDTKTEQDMLFIQKVIENIRNIRGELAVPPSKEIEVIINFKNKENSDTVKKYQKYLERLARVIKIQELTNEEKPKNSACAVINGEEIYVPLEGIIDIKREKERIQKEILRIQEMIDDTQKKLENSNFVNKAPQNVVEKEREKLQAFKLNLEKLQKNLSFL